MRLETMFLWAPLHGRLVRLFATFVADSMCMKGGKIAERPHRFMEKIIMARGPCVYTT
jgi:hypothetical protein